MSAGVTVSATAIEAASASRKATAISGKKAPETLSRKKSGKVASATTSVA